ncbi:asparagine synthase (glutamine-hydrolyzing) [Natronomonas sp. CBA1123]|uniref:asparagine synthase (glutamine-hydrolyzing) n=1 Tax=Natronomonas sp. CBA1123 TaxID=2668070 RepID=UPI001E5E0034|nr:asparagine synthase (glutamine-hydrolyzing) [Natronomonas sp. CBA1123]
MSESLVHRGPDDSGIQVDGSVGLVHRRLSIIDPDAPPQPLSNEDGTVAIVFNGEIYNHQQLRRSLSGHDFETDTDTEVLIHLYEEHGSSFVQRLEGMFAFALWDRDAERLLLARDRMGIKPLFLAEDGDRIGFASELPALLESPVKQGGLDNRAMSEYFTLGYVPAPRTAFQNINKVSPGEMVTVSDGSIERWQYYQPSIDTIDESFEDAVESVRQRVVEAVDKRLMSDVPLGAFLSGGIDSSIIAGVMAQQSETPVRTFTVGFESERFDESDAARAVAEFHDTDHAEYTVSIDDVREVIPSVLDRLGEPFADPSVIPTYIVSRETSNDVKVALSGDGADELFAGYNRYRGEYYSRFYRSLPRTARSMLIEPAMNRLPATRGSALGEAFRKAQDFTRVDDGDLPARHFEWIQKAPKESDAAYRDCKPFEAGAEVLQREHDTIESLLPQERSDDMARMLGVDTFFGLPDQLLRKVDRASMYNSLEVRVPFLDTGVVEFALGLPTDYKITARDRKRVLKEAFDDLLPKEIQNRSKQGFEMPIGEWLKDDLSDQFRRTVRESDTALLDSETILEMHDRHTSGRRDYEWFLWNVFVFARWHTRMQRQGYLEE